MTAEGSTRALRASVVVPTKDRAQLLDRLLDALDRQEGLDFEVLVVDDGSTDDTSARVRARIPSVSFDLHLVNSAVASGQATARNRGWRAAHGPIVLFTDDDCVPDPKWAATLVDALEREAAGVATGVTTYPDDQADSRVGWAYWVDDDGRTGYFPMANVAYRRDALESVGGLDEAFQYESRQGQRCMFGDDTDLAWRVIEAGHGWAVAPGAVVHHDVFSLTWREHLRNMRRLEGMPRVLQRHPQLRAHLGRRWTLRGEQPAALAAAAGLLGFLHPRLRPALLVGLAGAVSYAWITVRYKRRPIRTLEDARLTVLALVADAYASLVTLRSSLRHRTVLL